MLASVWTSIRKLCLLPCQPVTPDRMTVDQAGCFLIMRGARDSN